MKKYSIIVLVVCHFFITADAQILHDYLKVAAENNPGLRAKHKNVKADMQRVTQVSGLPDLNLSVGYFISPIETRVGPQRARFSLMQQFPWFGTLKAQKRAAALLAEAKYHEFLDARNQLFFQVAAAYYPLYELEKLIALEEENLSILSSYNDLATINFKNGKGSMVDVLRVDIMIKDAATNYAILKQKKKPLTTRFNKLLNRADSTVITIQDTLIVEDMPTDDQKKSLAASNPLLNILELKIEAGKADEQVARKHGLPKFSVGLDYALVDQRPDVSIIDNGKDALMPMLSVSLPLFRGKYKAAQQEARLMQESFFLQKEEALNRLTSAYETTLFEIRRQSELVALYDQQIQTSEQSLHLLFTAYSNSGKEFEEVLRMQQQILKYQKMKVTALTEYHLALAELNYITAETK